MKKIIITIMLLLVGCSEENGHIKKSDIIIPLIDNMTIEGVQESLQGIANCELFKIADRKFVACEVIHGPRQPFDFDSIK